MAYWTIAPTPTPTLLPQTTYSYMMNNITATGLILQLCLKQFYYLMDLQLHLVYRLPVFLLLFGFFINMWLTNGNLKIVSLVGMLFVGLFFVGGGIGIVLRLYVSYYI